MKIKNLKESNNIAEAMEDAFKELLDSGFTIMGGPVSSRDMPRLQAAYDLAVTSAESSDIHVGSTSTRVNDLVNRGAAFDDLYVYPPLLEACRRVIDRPFRLSTMHARTLHSGAEARPMHVDFAADNGGWPMVGFIMMVDDFREENGATRFVRGSQGWDASELTDAKQADEVAAVGPAGSMIVYNGSVWHEHGTNSSNLPRRSIQGAFIRRDESSGVDLPARMTKETLNRISPLAKYILGLEV